MDWEPGSTTGYGGRETVKEHVGKPVCLSAELCRGWLPGLGVPKELCPTMGDGPWTDEVGQTMDAVYPGSSPKTPVLVWGVHRGVHMSVQAGVRSPGLSLSR